MRLFRAVADTVGLLVSVAVVTGAGWLVFKVIQNATEGHI